MNKNCIIFHDYETGSKNPHRTQPTQLAAVAIDGRRLEIIGKFDSYINCEFDEEIMTKNEWDAVGEEALNITKISLGTIKAAPSLKVVWNNYCDWVKTFNYEKTKWGAPIPAGYNNNGFDDIITNRIAKMYGPWDDEYGKNALYHPIYNIDLMKLTWYWTENIQEIYSISMDSMRKFFGMPDEAAHNAVYDVEQGAQLLIRYLKLSRTIQPKTKFKNAFGHAKKEK